MPITNGKVRPAEFLRNIYAATPEAGTTLEDILNPDYWVHVAKTLHISDRIEVIPEDGSFYAELFVVSVTSNLVKVKLLSHHVLNDVGLPAEPEDEYEVVWRGQTNKHTVWRKKDKHIMKDGFATKQEAAQWMTAYLAGGVV